MQLILIKKLLKLHSSIVYINWVTIMVTCEIIVTGCMFQGSKVLLNQQVILSLPNSCYAEII